MEKAGTLKLEASVLGDCYKDALIRALRKYKLAHWRMRLGDKDGVWIELPEKLLERIFKEAQLCYEKQNTTKKSSGNGNGNGKPPPLAMVTLS